MKILALVHGYPPVQNAGAEWMLHEMLKFCVERGHGVEVRLPISGLKPYNLEGVRVEKDTWEETKESVKTADIIISHLDRAGRSLNVCEFYKKPFIQVIHNSNYYGILASKHRELVNRFVYVVYNSEFTKVACKYPNPSCIVHPPVDSTRYRVGEKKPAKVKIKGVKTIEVQTIKQEDKPVKSGKKITLINLFERKGGLFFNDLIRLMPDYEFLGVEGGYGKQEKSNLPNVTYMENTPDARNIYSQTRILLMPSQYESYGRTGIEAFCSGIPVIATPTPGLLESLGDAGIFCSLESPLKWVEAIKKLDDEKYYSEVSKKCIERAKDIEINSEKELNDMVNFFEDVLNKRV
jgi:glycosyltransferase involved in cell wall biosynthesis